MIGMVGAIIFFKYFFFYVEKLQIKTIKTGIFLYFLEILKKKKKMFHKKNLGRVGLPKTNDFFKALAYSTTFHNL